MTNYERECLRASETLPGDFEYQEARLAAQRRMDELSFGIHRALDGGTTTLSQGGEIDWAGMLRSMGAPIAEAVRDDGETEQALMYFLTSLHIEGDNYLYRGHVYPADMDQVDDLIRWQRARLATDEDVEQQEADQCEGQGSEQTIG